MNNILDYIKVSDTPLWSDLNTQLNIYNIDETYNVLIIREKTRDSLYNITVDDYNEELCLVNDVNNPRIIKIYKTSILSVSINRNLINIINTTYNINKIKTLS